MAAEKEIMVAIEFGSSKIRGIAGCRNLDGTIHILDVVQEDAKNCIRKGVIYNMDKTVLCLKRIVQKLESDLDLEVIKVYVGLNGKSLRTVKNVVSRQLDTKIVISSDLVDGLCESNKETVYPDYEILEVVPQEYRIGAELTLDPVGILSNQLEGRFLNVIARTTIKEYVRKCVEAADLEIAGYFITPLAQADSVLTDTERRSGCVLVDFGADLTTVAIYKNNVLRHLAVIPLGGNRCSKFRKSFNILVTFLVSGLWHGANFTFIAWGAIHGICHIIEDLTLKFKNEVFDYYSSNFVRGEKLIVWGYRGNKENTFTVKLYGSVKKENINTHTVIKI